MTIDQGSPFASEETLAGAFSQGLHQLLDRDAGLGAFILVLANALAAGCDDGANRWGGYEDLHPRLARRYAELADQCRALLLRGQKPAAPLDDLMVFLQLMAVGFDHLTPPQTRREEVWQLQFNGLRGFRPERASAERIDTLYKPFHQDCFHFNKPFLAAETFWRGDFLGKPVALLYNKFPFMPLHGLWVPEPDRNHPQFLNEALHGYIDHCCNRLGRSLPAIGLGYNSLGAGASVNHLHAQLFVTKEPLPVELGCWTHNGGQATYPAQCLAYRDRAAAWRAIEQYHQRNIAYNILYRPGVCYLMPRRFQGGFERQPWLSAITWNELSGGLVLVDRSDFDGLTAGRISAQLAACQP